MLAPTVSALSAMVKTCETFGHNTGLQFNSKKTVCIQFHSSGACKAQHNAIDIYLDNARLQWCDSVKHLGHTISCCANFDKDIVNKKCHFIACVNDILTEFSFAHPHVKCKLLQIYGTSFYGSCLWDLYGSAIKSLYTTWNIALRKLNGVPYRTHTRYLDTISGIKHVSFILKRRFLCFVQKLMKSENILLCNIVNMMLHDVSAPTSTVLSRILSEYDLGTVSSFITNFENISYMFDSNYIKVHGLTQEESSYCHTIVEIIDCIHGSLDVHLNKEQCQILIDQLSTI